MADTLEHGPYGWYLRGYVEGLARSAGGVPGLARTEGSTAPVDDVLGASYAVGYRDGGRGSDIQVKAQVASLVAQLLGTTT